jgi:hypothetical protein
MWLLPRQRGTDSAMIEKCGLPYHSNDGLFAGHVISHSDPQIAIKVIHTHDYYERSVSWFDSYLTPTASNN